MAVIAVCNFWSNNFRGFVRLHLLIHQTELLLAALSMERHAATRLTPNVVSGCFNFWMFLDVSCVANG